jgi:hypothetical protein
MFFFKIFAISTIIILLYFLFSVKRGDVLESMQNSMRDELLSLTSPAKGFCETYRGKSDELEEECSNLAESSCNKTECCVWTSNSKCSAGGMNGATFKTDESGNMITMDYYYYKNKCYGNC